MKVHNIARELRIRAPFTAFGTGTGIGIMALVIHVHPPWEILSILFWMFHPLPVVLNALVTVVTDGTYRLNNRWGYWCWWHERYFGNPTQEKPAACLRILAAVMWHR